MPGLADKLKKIKATNQKDQKEADKKMSELKKAYDAADGVINSNKSTKKELIALEDSKGER